MKSQTALLSTGKESGKKDYLKVETRSAHASTEGLTRRVRLMNILVSTITYRSALQQIIDRARLNLRGYCCFVNAHVTVEAQNPEYANMINRSMLSVSDGMSLVFAMKMIYGLQQERIAGMDMINSVLKECDKNHFKVFIFGGSEQSQKAFADKISQEFPNVDIAGAIAPPMGEIESYDNATICDEINKSGANIVFVGLGCPKQERWMARYSSQINAVLLGIGGAMPVFAGQVSRAPIWMQTNGLEWLFRLYKEPGRLWKRYFTTNTLFIYGILKQKLGLGMSRGSMQSATALAKPSQKTDLSGIIDFNNQIRKSGIR